MQIIQEIGAGFFAHLPSHRDCSPKGHRRRDGRVRFFLATGEAPDKPRQFIGTSLVISTDSDSREIVEKSVLDGFEPHFVVMKGNHVKALEALADMLGFEVYRY